MKRGGRAPPSLLEKEQLPTAPQKDPIMEEAGEAEPVVKMEEKEIGNVGGVPASPAVVKAPGRKPRGGAGSVPRNQATTAGIVLCAAARSSIRPF